MKNVSSKRLDEFREKRNFREKCNFNDIKSD